jgi:hypothetical protein
MWFVDIKDGTARTRQSCRFINVNAVHVAGVPLVLKNIKGVTEKKYNIRSILAKVIKKSTGIYAKEYLFAN